MANGSELGVEWISILPSMSKFAGQLSKGVTSASKQAAKSFTDQFSQGVVKGASNTGKEAGAAMARAALAAARSDVAKLKKSIEGVADKQADALGKLRVAEQKLNDAREKHATTTRRVQDAEEKLAALWDDETADIQAIEKAEKELERARSAANSATTRLTSAEESVASAKRKASTATNDLTHASIDLANAQKKEKAAAEAVGKAQQDASKKASLGARLGGQFKDAFNKGFKPAEGIENELKKAKGDAAGRAVGGRFGGAFSNSFRGLATKAIATLAAATATIGIGNFVKDTVNLEAEFSRTMNTMAAVAKVPAAEMKTLNDLALQLGAETTFSASEAATAMLELAKAGLTPATIQAGALAGTLTLAAAGGTSLETAATIAGNALNTFSLKGSDMNAVAAAMAGAANASTASIESLGEALSQVGPGAATAGLTLNDTVGVLAAFDNAGIKGSDAGTSLKTMLTRLVPTTKAAREAMRELGLKFTDASGQFLPITNVAEQLRLKLSKLSDEQRTQALSTIFGSDATRAATVLMKEGAAGIEGYIKATKDQNAAQEAANAGMKGTAGAVENFKGAIETAKIEIGLLIAPAIQAGLAKLSDGISRIGPAIRGVVALIGKGDFTKDFREAFNVAEDSPIVASLLNLRTTVGQVFSELKSRISPIVRDLVDGFKNLVPPVVEFARNLATDLLPPAKEIAKALVGVALILTGTVASAFKSVTGFVKDNSTLVQTLAVAVLTGVAAWKAYQAALVAVKVAGVGLRFLSLLPTVIGLIGVALKSAFLSNPIGIILTALVALGVGLVYAYKHSETFRKVVDSAFNGAKTVVLAVVGALVTAFHAVVKAFQAVGSAIGAAIDWIKGAFEAVKTGVSAAVTFIGKVWSAIVTVLMTPVNLFLKVLQGVWARIYPILVLPFYIANTAINAVWNLIKDGFNAAWTWVSTNFVKGWNKTRDILTGPINSAKAWIDRKWYEFKLGFNFLKDYVTGGFAKAWNKVKETLTGPINSAKAWIDRKWYEFKLGFNFLKDYVTGEFAKAWNKVKTTLSKPIADAKAQIATILGAGKGGLQTVFRGAVKAIGVIWDTIKGVMKSPVKFVIDIVLNDGLISGFNWIANKFKAPTIPRIPLPPGFAEGGQFSGRLPGQPSAVDNMLGMSAAGPVALATGEYIVNARDTARSLPLLEHINSGGQLPGFADGGLFGKLKSAISSGFNAGKEFGKDALGFLGNPIDWFKKRFAGPLNRLNELGDSTLAQTVKAMPKRAADAIIDGAKSLLGLGGDGAGGFNASLGGVLNFVRSQVGKPYVWGGVGPGGYDCSGLVSAAINVALGRNPYSRIGATGSMPWSMFAPGLGAFSVGWFKGNPGHTAATVNGINIESRGGRGVLMGPSARGATNPLFTNRAHVKGFAQGGLLGDPPFDLLSKRGKAFKPEALLFDNGGVLPTGVSTVVNNTGKPEPLYREALTREDMDGMAFVLDVPSVGVLTGHIDARADSRITAANKQTKRRVGQGVRK